MKKYNDYTENERIKQDGIRQKYEELLLFQDMLRNSALMNEKYRGKAHEIASGIQAWIDALELSLKH